MQSTGKIVLDITTHLLNAEECDAEIKKDYEITVLFICVSACPSLKIVKELTDFDQT
jgi:hypothetical protein